MAAAYGWKSAWHVIGEDDDIDEHYYHGTKKYELPTGKTIYEGDEFWDAEERYIITVEAVKTKVYQGVVGYKGEEGNDNVFFDRGWQPPRSPEMMAERSPRGRGATHSSHADRINFLSVDEFARRIEDDELIPHRGNGLPPLPP